MSQADGWGITFICQGVEDIGRVLLRGRVELRHDVRVLHGQVFHRLIARHAVDRRAVFGVGVFIAE